MATPPRVCKMTLHCEPVPAGTRNVFFRVIDVSPIKEIPSRPRAPKSAGLEVDADSSDAESCHAHEFLTDSDEESLASAAESAAADDVEDAPADEDVLSDDEEVDPGLAASKRVSSNGYFSLSRNLHAGQQRALDAKVVSRPTFAIEGELGRERRSKTVLVSHCDGPGAPEPRQTYLALRAWQLWRSQTHNWHTRHPARHAWFQREEEMLRRDVANIPLSGPCKAFKGLLGSSWVLKTIKGLIRPLRAP